MTQSAPNQHSQSLDFDRLYTDHLKAVKCMVRRFRFPDAIADDLVQEIFLTAWQNLHQIKVKEAFSGWLRTLAKNKCLNELRKSGRERPIDMSDYQASVIAFEKEAANPFSSRDIEEAHQYLELLIEMHQDKVRKQVAIQFYLEHRSIKEIAEELDMNSNTVLSHLRRFRLVIKKALLEMAQEKDWDLDSWNNNGVFNMAMSL